MRPLLLPLVPGRRSAPLARMLLVLAALAGALQAGGCAYKDIDKRSFVVAMGVDRSDDPARPLRVTLKIAIPTADIKSGENRFLLLSADGRLIAEAVHRLQGMNENAFDFSHTKLIFIGRDLAEARPLRETLDWFIRMETIQGIALVALAEPSAEAALRVSPPMERLPSNSLFTALDGSGTLSPYITHAYLFDVVRRLYEPGLDPILPLVEAAGKKAFRIERSGLFDKSRLRLVLSPEETEWLNFLRGETANVDFVFGRDRLYFQADPNRARTRLAVESRGRTLRLVVDVELYGSIDERQKETAALPAITRAIEADVKTRTESLLRRLQEAGVDPLGLGLRAAARGLAAGDPEAVIRSLDFTVRTHIVVYETGNVLR
ncbi:Ger(x)C family spore germination C-terminal domain-containing protein [Hydrogenibacillus schlegelii]|uniref:Germination protein n=1 Tax=Hydrogenibacillus schlegelii TaxID=1484 RepID=A0A132NCB3_HYDSH|nr:Ger(x)C family spore germination C-terminal domain-containing protein [Hydrogenibacillus schlegelii]KWX07212.1 hypothetical protein TR75_03705 [Hydrogenibacillus schlegelii]OAR03892.1 hypothetical protein SA87_03425 [Hydrogenibacillus schlegelii]PTQ54793.1 MAG: germination protein [Hydrogenibacillus schlegelii]